MKRSIGIDINRDKISIVQLCYMGGKFSLERASVREIPQGDSLEEKSTVDIKSLINSILTEEDFDMSAKVTITAPSDRVFFQNFRMDLSVDENVQQLIKYELEDDFPIPFDELVVGICGSRELKGDDREYLVGAINRLDLHSRINTIKQAQLKCSTVTADVCALHTIASVSCNLIDDGLSVVIHSDNSRIILVISVNGRLVCARHFNSQNEAGDEKTLTSIQVLTREIEMTLRAIFGLHADTKLKVYISSNNELLDDLSVRLPEAINCEVVTFNPFQKIDCSEQQRPNTNLVIASGLALIGTDEIPEVLNFLAIDALNSDQTEEIKKGLLIAGFLVFIIGTLLVAKLFYERSKLEYQHRLIKKQIREVFVQTLPEERKIVNEFAQMNEQLQTVQTEYSTLAAGLSDRVLPLKILQVISEKIIAGQNIHINDISMAPESVRLLGAAASFESVDNFMSALRQVSEFNKVEVRSIDVDPQSSGVRFTLLITPVLE